MVVRGRVHGGAVVCEVRVGAGPVVRDRVDRTAPGTPRSASTSPNPRARLLEVRARGSSDDLAGQVTCSRVG